MFECTIAWLDYPTIQHECRGWIMFIKVCSYSVPIDIFEEMQHPRVKHVLPCHGPCIHYTNGSIEDWMDCLKERGLHGLFWIYSLDLLPVLCCPGWLDDDDVMCIPTAWPMGFGSCTSWTLKWDWKFCRLFDEPIPVVTLCYAGFFF